MLNTMADFSRSGFWFDVACLTAGIAVVSPVLVSKSLRKRLAHSDLDLEKIGLIALIMGLVAIGAYNRFTQ